MPLFCSCQSGFEWNEVEHCPRVWEWRCVNRRVSQMYISSRASALIVYSPDAWAPTCLRQLGKNFDPDAKDFNLEGVFSLGLHNLAEFIGELSTNANKELGIEQVGHRSRWTRRFVAGIRFDSCGGGSGHSARAKLRQFDSFASAAWDFLPLCLRA